MATIENFLLRFKVDGQQAITNASNSIKNLSDEVANLGASTGPLGSGLTNIIGRLGPLGVAAGAAAGAFAALGLRAVQLADEIADIGDATGISAGALLNFKQSVMEAGGGANDFAGLAIKLNQAVGEAADGNEKLQNTFRTLGVYVTDSGGKIRDTESILRDAIRSLANIEDPARRAALATDLFGKAAASLDLTKLNALRDPIADEDIKRLADYQAAIDRLRGSLERGLISFFGSVAEQANAAFAAIDKYDQKILEAERKLNERGLTSRPFIPNQPMGGSIGSTGLPDFMQRRMTAEERAFLEQQRRYAEMERLMAPAAGQPRWQEPQAPGGFGRTPQSQVDRAARDAERLAESRRRAVLRGEEEAARQREENAAAIAKFELEQGQAELRRYDQTQRLVRQGQLDAEAQRQADAEALAQQEANWARAAEAGRQQVEQLRQNITVGRERIELERQLIGVDQITADVRRKIFDLEQRRTSELERLRNIQNLTFDERQKREQDINNEINRAIDLERLRGEELRTSQSSFSEGWKDAFAKYADSAANAADQARTYFERFSRGFEDLIVSFVTKGKFSFKDFANSIIADFARIEARKMFSALFGSKDSSGSILMTAFNWGKSLFGLANGGQVAGGRPYIVGERGPELFIPRGQGTVVANNQLGQEPRTMMTTVNYTIQAVDAASFRSLVARDPSFIYAVTEQGRRSQPSRRMA